MHKVLDWFIWMIVGTIVYAVVFAALFYIATILLKVTGNLFAVLIIVAAINALITWFTTDYKK